MKATITIELEGTDDLEFKRIARDLAEGFFVARAKNYPSIVWKHPAYPKSILTAKLRLDVESEGQSETTVYPLGYYIGDPRFEKRKDKFQNNHQDKKKDE